MPDTCWKQATALTASERAGRSQEIQSAQQTSVSTPCWSETALHCITGESHRQLNQSSRWTRGGVGQWERRVGDLKNMLIEVCLCNLCYSGLKSGTVAMKSRTQTRRDRRTQASSHGAIFDQMYASATKTWYFWRFCVDSQRVVQKLHRCSEGSLLVCTRGVPPKLFGEFHTCLAQRR